jgi:hypothetical protein
MRLRIVGIDLPGRTFHDAGFTEKTWRCVHVGVQRDSDVVDVVPGDAPAAEWEIDVDVRPGRTGDLDQFGPYVQGRPGKRFVYLSWGDVGDDGSFDMFRRIKLWLNQVDPSILEQADQPGRRLEAHLRLTDSCGGPLCGGLDPSLVEWRLGSAT